MTSNPTSIALPKQLDADALISVIDYMHGYEFKLPPEHKYAAFYTCVSYFKFFPLMDKLRILMKQHNPNFPTEVLDTKAHKMQFPVILKPGMQIFRTSELP